MTNVKITLWMRIGEYPQPSIVALVTDDVHAHANNCMTRTTCMNQKSQNAFALKFGWRAFLRIHVDTTLGMDILASFFPI